jgi:hypothetical protein
MLQIILFYFCVAHVVFKFDYHMQISSSILKGLGLGLGLSGEVSGLGLVGEGLGLGLGLVPMVSVSSFMVSCLEAFRDLPQ